LKESLLVGFLEGEPSGDRSIAWHLGSGHLLLEQEEPEKSSSSSSCRSGEARRAGCLGVWDGVADGEVGGGVAGVREASTHLPCKNKAFQSL
jgi:hypothetical protein